MATYTTHHRHTLLLSTSQLFCNTFSSPTPPSPSSILTKFFTPLNPRITEHGPAWATSRLPFLGKTFEGREGCEEYFRVLGEVLEVGPVKGGGGMFPGREGFVIDCEAGGDVDDEGHRKILEEGNGDRKGNGLVCVVGKGRFQAKKTGKEWEEQFIYRLSGFDDEGRIGHWEIWADPLSAWEAVGE